MHTRLNVVMGAVLVLVGCARFDHQTSPSEAHAVLRFADEKDTGRELPRAKTLDGLAVTTGRSYRVKPGKHELVCELVRVSVKTREPTDIGLKTEKGYAVLHIPGERSATFRTEHVTNLFSVEAGCAYDVEGEDVSKSVFQGREIKPRTARQPDASPAVLSPQTEAARKRFEENRAKAETGDAEAQNDLGVCFFRGEGVAKDPGEAVKWYLKAAEQGLADAQYNLGCCYIAGDGVASDYVRAYKWLSLASTQGDGAAKRLLSKIEKEMTPDQISEGSRLALEFKPRQTGLEEPIVVQPLKL